jgi:hypothetical protein
VVVDELGVEALCVAAHAIHQVRTLQMLDVTRPVVDLGGGHQLAALLDAGDQHRLQVGAGGVDGGRVAGGAGAENDQRVMVAHDFSVTDKECGTQV